jgi:hypothetical protein
MERESLPLHPEVRVLVHDASDGVVAAGQRYGFLLHLEGQSLAMIIVFRIHAYSVGSRVEERQRLHD